MENFTITVLNSTGGARLGNKLTANLQINKNDDPIYFSGKYTAHDIKGFSERVKNTWIYYTYSHSLPCLALFSEPVVVRLREGAVANFNVLRAGHADFVATVMYRVEFGNASPGDLTVLSNDTLLVFDVGEWMKNISVAVEDDNIPETDEPFYIVLYNATGEYNITSFPPLSPLVLMPAVYVRRGVAGWFSIVCGNTESSPNPSIVCQGWEWKTSGPQQDLNYQTPDFLRHKDCLLHQPPSVYWLTWSRVE